MQTILDDLIRWADETPDAPAVAEGAEVVHSFASLADRVTRLAGGLQRRGIGPGQRVAILSANCPAYFEALFAIWHAGAAAVPINARLAQAETDWIIDHADVALIIASPALADQAAHAGSAVVAMGTTAWEALIGDPVTRIDVAADDLAWLFYTSGTTGRPKGAMITHRNLDAMCHAYLASVDPDPPWSAILHPAPLSHGSGLYALAHVRAGAVQVVPVSGGFKEQELADLVHLWPGAVFFAAPTILRRLTAAGVDLTPLKAAIFGGAPMAVADIDAFLAAHGPRLAQLYGQGEAPMTISALSRGALAAGDAGLRASAGAAQAGVELAVLGEDAAPVAQGARGEVAVRGDVVCAGYWRDAKASAATFVDGWLRTGDIGWLDAAGILTLVDRSKDLIISGGYNIYPREVEEVLIAHPDVIEAAVIARHDAEYGEAVVAYVVGDVSAQTLDTFCLERMARYKRPRAYRHVSELPRNNYGKVLKTELRARETRFTQ